MLSGKIIKISWLGDQGWRLNIDGMMKMFDNCEAMETWLIGIIDKVKDQEKRKLLLDDLNKFLVWQPKYPRIERGIITSHGNTPAIIIKLNENTRFVQ